MGGYVMRSVIKDDIRIQHNNRYNNRSTDSLYRRRFRRYVGDDFLLRDDLNYVIAGGFLDTRTIGRQIKDVDIYTLDEETNRKIKATLINNDWELTNNTWMKNGKKVQVLDGYTDPIDVLLSFDFTVCMKGWVPNTQTIYTHENWARHIVTKQLVYNLNSKYPIKNIIHLTKYISYGFHIGPKDLMAILFKINKLDLQNQEVFKEHLMYYESQGLLDEYTTLFKQINDQPIPREQISLPLGELIQ